MPGIRLICMDVDGTLLGKNGKISDINIAAMKAAQQKGIVVAIATGRTPANLMVFLEDAGIKCPVVGINGTHVVDENNRDLFQYFMNHESALMVQERLSNLDTEYNVNAENVWCMNREVNSYPMERETHKRLLKYRLETWMGAENAKKSTEERNVYKFFAYNCKDTQEVRDAMQGIPHIELSRSGKDNVEIMPQGADKALGVRMLAKHYGIRLQDVMTIGDEMNDLPMIRAAGWGIAMGNAVDEVKKAARYVTEHCYEDGVAKAIWRYAL